MRTSATILALFAAAVVGCAAPLSPGFLSGSRQQDDVVHVDDREADADSPRARAVQKATAEKPVSQEEALADIIEELQEIRALDPEAEKQLMADLKAAKPEHYPMIVDAFRAALAYRQQLAEREEREADDAPLIATDDTFGELMPHETPMPQRDSADRAAAVKASLAAARAAKLGRHSESPESSERLDASRFDTRALDASSMDAGRYAVTPASMETPVTPEAVYSGGEVAALPSRGPATAAPNTSGSAIGPAGAAADARPAPSGGVVRAAGVGDWQANLMQSIAELERTVAAKPTSVVELHDHMRLRTLQLLAGRQEEAFRPIPGASADQQDYWSKQLFAISAYLDAGGKLDDKQRSAAALSALDEARGKLAELATLQVRNAAFVTSVDGYGAYQPAKGTTFQPGEKVTLYAEVENFRSNAAEDGYHTSLATSYQVLDKTGRRVDGKQFPDVADKCRNRRRDFHMQYEFPLPTRIYPGEYDLELTITDHNSGKIGQTTLPFEIAGDTSK